MSSTNAVLRSNLTPITPTLEVKQAALACFREATQTYDLLDFLCDHPLTRSGTVCQTTLINNLSEIAGQANKRLEHLNIHIGCEPAVDANGNRVMLTNRRRRTMAEQWSIYDSTQSTANRRFSKDRNQSINREIVG